MLRNALIHTGMLDGEPVVPENVYEYPYSAEQGVRTKASGLVASYRKSGEVLREGELLAEVIDLWTFEVADRVLAPFDCLLSRAAWNSYVEAGWRVCKVVRLEESRWSDQA
jgi:predicted deacylase